MWGFPNSSFGARLNRSFFRCVRTADVLAKACYKKRFARINAGKLTKSAFYAWSEEARKKKEDCDNGVISPEVTTDLLLGFFIDY